MAYIASVGAGCPNFVYLDADGTTRRLHEARILPEDRSVIAQSASEGETYRFDGNQGWRVDVATVPRAIKFTGKSRKLLDGQFELESAAFKALVEQFEPGVHQFVPVEVYSQHGRLLDVRQRLIIGQRLDAIDHERSHLRKGIGGGYTYMPGALLGPANQAQIMILRKEIVANHHLWRDTHYDIAPFMSNALYKAVRAARMGGFRYTKVDEK